MVGRAKKTTWQRHQGIAVANNNFVFVSVGTHPQQFNRLLEEIDRLVQAGKISGRVLCQSGHSDYSTKYFESKKFMGIEEFGKNVIAAGIFITHAGEGNIGLAKNSGAKFICVPRRKEFGEHTNDHQLELAKVVEEMGLGLVAWNPGDLESRLAQLKGFRAADVPRGRINGILDEYFAKAFG
ncbi:Uncharacterised protein [uncultured archaeon]|nr:Uncharacterised protein [uncultured archaeon]